jgi:hypothetical protein
MWLFQEADRVRHHVRNPSGENKRINVAAIAREKSQRSDEGYAGSGQSFWLNVTPISRGLLMIGWKGGKSG